MILLNGSTPEDRLLEAAKKEAEKLRGLFTPAIIFGATIWACLFTLLYFSPKFGLGRIWKDRIWDYDRATISLGILTTAVTFITFVVCVILDPILKNEPTTQWWHGLVLGFGLGAVISLVTIIVNAIHRLLYDRASINVEPESWGLIWVRCGYYMIMLTVTGMILTAFR